MTDSPLRLAIDIGPLSGHRTGVGVAVDGLVTALRARDDVELDPYLVSFRARPDTGHRRLPLPGIVASHVWSRSDRPHADRWLRGVDIVHGTNYVAPPTAIPTVISVYDCWFLRHPELASPIVRRAGRALRRAVGRGAWIHASSDATASEVRTLLGTDRVATIHLGPPPSSTHRGEPPPVAGRIGGRPFVVCLATEERRKAIPMVVEAFGLLARDQPETDLVLAGAAGDDSAEVTSAIERHCGDLGVHRLGPVDDATKWWLLRHAALLAYPSLDEGFGFPVLEAQAAGTPVVASSVGSIPEIAGDAARLVAERDPAAFAAAIQEVLTAGAARLGLIEAGYRNVGRFSWATTTERMVSLYETVLAASR